MAWRTSIKYVKDRQQAVFFRVSSRIMSEILQDEIIKYWLYKFRKSNMFILHKRKKPTFNTEKAVQHLKYVELYDNLFKIISNKHALLNLEGGISYRNFRGKEYQERQQNKYDKYYPRYKLEILEYEENINAICKALKLQYTLSELEEDLKASRFIVSNIFLKIFKQYGIELNPVMLMNIFGFEGHYVKNDSKGFETYKRKDKVLLYVKGTSFYNNFSYQFSKYQNGKAAGIFSAFFMRAAGCFEGRSNEPNFKEDNKNNDQDNNPFNREKTVIRILAKASADYFIARGLKSIEDYEAWAKSRYQ